MPLTDKELITSDDFIDVALESAFKYTRSSRYTPPRAETRAEVYDRLAKVYRHTLHRDRLSEEPTWIKQQLKKFEYTDFTKLLRVGLFPDISSIITHLKFLRVFRDLRVEIMARDGMFGITDAEFPSNASSSGKDGRLLRWQVYVTYAVERYTKWFESLPSRGPIGKTGLSFDLHGEGEAYEITVENLPPIDVLVVLHSHMLHPRVYWQDLMRSNRMSVFRSMKMPWEALESAIQQPSNPNGAWKYSPSETAREYFEVNTMRQFDLEDDSNSKCVVCPQCSSLNPVELYNKSGTGWVQSEFEATCTECRYRLTRDILTTAALLDDCQAFEERGVPLKGALLDYIGVQYPSKDSHAIPGALNAQVTALFAHITHREDFDIAQSKVREVFNKLSSSAVTEKRPRTKEFRVLSYYVKNCTPFCIDLELAVLRQCDFADKMVKYAYLHSPFRENVLKQATVRFFKFFFLVCFNADEFLAPPIDADIAWHTMLLDPAAYAATSFSFMGSIMDHDDDVADDAMSKSHEMTKREWRRYKKVDDFGYDGCTCAICQATREFDALPEQKKFKTSLKSRFSSKSSRAARIDQFYAIKCEERILSGDTLVQRLTHTYSTAEQFKLSAKARAQPNYSHPYFLDLTPTPTLSEKETGLPSYADLPPAYTSEPAASESFGEIARTRYGKTAWTPYYEFEYTVAMLMPASVYMGSVAGGGGFAGGLGTYGGGCATLRIRPRGCSSARKKSHFQQDVKQADSSYLVVDSAVGGRQGADEAQTSRWRQSCSSRSVPVTAPPISIAKSTVGTLLENDAYAEPATLKPGLASPELSVATRITRSRVQPFVCLRRLISFSLISSSYPEMASLPPSIPYQHTTVMPPAHKELITSDDFIDVALESAFRYTRSSRYAPLTAETHAEVYEQLAKACSNTPNLDLLREESTWIKEKLRQFEFTNYTEMLRAGLFPGISSVTTHLKLLRVLRDLRTEIMARDGMFGITDAEFPSYASSSDYDGRRLRWQVYVTYAVERYTKWFESLPSKGPISKTGPSYDLHGEGEAYEITTESLPPIDVLMVLHSHMLHPRVYWQDLMRSNRIGVFRSMKMPWEAMESAIQQPSNPNGAWKYNPFETAREYFELNTMRQFDLEDDSNLKCVVCPQCSSINSVELYNESGTGWVQSEFESTCTGCKYRITRDVLATAALLDDCQAFEERGVPLKGALLDYIGVQYSSQDFYAIPGALNAEVTALFAHITHREDFDIAQSKVREVFNKLSSSAVAEHRWHTKEFRVLSSYVKNCTPFCIDLELAVLRQCDFADEIVKYAYLHSPFRENMIKQATVRFFKFFFLVCFNADDFLAPPIDADIVWHTVMLDPAAYAATSFAFMGSIMDHNDDVADDTLSKSHELTMREWKRYKKVDDFSYDGCTCAICQATREYDSQPEQRKFKTSLKSRFLSKSSRAATIDQFYAIKCEELILSGDTLVQRLTHTYSVAEHLKLSAKAPVEPNYSHPYFLDLTPSPILSEKESQLPSYDDLPPAYTSEPAASDGFGEISSTRYGQKVWTPYYEYAYTIATVLPAAYYVGSVAGGGGLGGGSGTYGGGCASGTHPSGGCGGGGCGGGGN